MDRRTCTCLLIFQRILNHTTLRDSMSALGPQPGLRTLVLTPQRIPEFRIPSPSPRFRQAVAERTRLLSDPDVVAQSRSPRGCLQLRIPSPRPTKAGSCDMDVSTRAALSLPHLARVTTPYGFGAVLAASPCTNRRESLYHRRPLAEDDEDPDDQDPPAALATSPSPCRSRLLQLIQAMGQQLVRKLQRPASVLKALSPAHSDPYLR